jgi:hypothetical protein
MEQRKQHDLKVQKGYSEKILITEHNGRVGTTCFIYGISWVNSAQKLAILNDDVHGYIQSLQPNARIETSNYTTTSFLSYPL